MKRTAPSDIRIWPILRLCFRDRKSVRSTHTSTTNPARNTINKKAIAAESGAELPTVRIILPPHYWLNLSSKVATSSSVLLDFNAWTTSPKYWQSDDPTVEH